VPQTPRRCTDPSETDAVMPRPLRYVPPRAVVRLHATLAFAAAERLVVTRP
jgi:hypothetical protein